MAPREHGVLALLPPDPPASPHEPGLSANLCSLKVGGPGLLHHHGCADYEVPQELGGSGQAQWCASEQVSCQECPFSPILVVILLHIQPRSHLLQSLPWPPRWTHLSFLSQALCTRKLACPTLVAPGGVPVFPSHWTRSSWRAGLC